MNRHEYLVELEKALRAAQVQDSGDIVQEYSEHFDLKLRDGYGEEEIAAKLASPKDIASQFASIRPVSGTGKGSRMMLSVGLTFSDIFVGPFFILMYAWVIVMGAFSIASAGLGVAAAARVSLWNLIPYMPHVCAILLGLSMMALAVLSVIGTEYCRLYVTQLLKVYIRWHKVTLGNGGRVSPPLTMHPQIEGKKRRSMRTIALISLVVFAVCCIAGFVSMMIAAGSFEPWHVWNWFQ